MRWIKFSFLGSLLSLILLALAAVNVSASDELKFEWKEGFRPGLTTDFGHIVDGRYGAGELEFFPLNRNIVSLENSATYGSSWEFNAGFKGVIWWPFAINASEPFFKNIRVEPQISQIKARYILSQGSSPTFMEFGAFPYKYNPDAVNLGEYLYRSGTYPGIVRTTDGFHLMNHALFDAYGAHMQISHKNGIKHHLNLFAEPVTYPAGDLTAAYEIEFSNSLFDVGAGVAFDRLISFRPSLNQPKTKDNAYVRVDSIGVDSSGVPIVFEGPLSEAPNEIQSAIESGDTSLNYSAEYWTQRGVKLMMRIALDLGFLIPETIRNPKDLRIFTELAILGLENQAYFYENRKERSPIMFGLNLPTLKVLDLLSYQMEYYPSPYNNSQTFNTSGYPRWEGNDKEKNSWKWSIHALKSVNRILNIRFQIANDHLRLPNAVQNPTETDLTQGPKNWYYLARLECRL